LNLCLFFAGSCAGIRGVEWDAVELPSQFMENFLYDRDVSRLVSAHVDTGASLPDDMLAKLHKAKNHHAALQLLRQLHFALTDLRLHSSSEFASFPNAFALERDQATLTTVKPVLSDARFLCAFSHIFAGGYASGYYSYKWAEVLSADAYGAFDEFSASDQKWQQWRGVGRRFRDTVLSLGGAVAPAEVFQRFRGRAPSPDALLESCGLKQARAASAAAKTEL
jgi:oligopeptidase A